MANLFCIKDRVVIITGGAGILGSGIAGFLLIDTFDNGHGCCDYALFAVHDYQMHRLG